MNQKLISKREETACCLLLKSCFAVAPVYDVIEASYAHIVKPKMH